MLTSDCKPIESNAGCMTTSSKSYPLLWLSLSPSYKQTPHTSLFLPPGWLWLQRRRLFTRSFLPHSSTVWRNILSSIPLCSQNGSWMCCNTSRTGYSNSPMSLEHQSKSVCLPIYIYMEWRVQKIPKWEEKEIIAVIIVFAECLSVRLIILLYLFSVGLHNYALKSINICHANIRHT